MSTPDTDRLLCWVDVETTGLDEQRGAILEVGLILTDWTLRELDARSWCVRFVGRVDPAIATMHGPTGSGLLAPDHGGAMCCDGLPVADVEAMARAWLHERCPEAAPLWAGRNVAFDRVWLREHMPRLCDALHYRGRCIEEAALVTALAMWGGVHIPKHANGGPKHRTLDDLRESLRVMRAVREWMTGRAA